MKKILIIFLCLTTHLNAQTFKWVNNFSNSIVTGGTNIFIDNLGNTTTTVYSSTRVSHGIDTTWGFIKQYGINGSEIWNNKSSSFRGTGFDPNGNSATVIKDVISLTDISGNNLWNRKLTFNERNTIIQYVEFDKNDNYIISGIFVADTIKFGSFTLINSTLNPNFFIAKFDKGGVCIWAKQSFGPGSITVNAFNIDKAGNIFIGGSFINSMSIGATTITEYNKGNGYIAKFDNNGNIKLLLNIDGSGKDKVTSLSTDNAGNLYFLGYANDRLALGNIVLDSSYQNIFFAKLNPSGVSIWAKRMYSGGFDDHNDIWIDNNNNAYLTGYVGVSSKIDNLLLRRDGLFIVKFDSSGKGLWSTQPSGSGFALGGAITGDNKGNIAVTGGFKGVLTFGNKTISEKSTATESADMFVTMLVDTSLITSANNILNKSDELYIYPNPTTGIVKIDNQGSEANTQIFVRDLLGETLLQKTFNESSLTLDLNHLPKGIYFIDVLSQSGKITKEIVLQ
jgi:hypothetical protein